METTEKICVFTGHRDLGRDFSEKLLKQAIKASLDKGYYTFLNGMAIGFDMRAAEILLSLKRTYPQIKLIACIPCENQEKYFSLTDKKRYYKLLEKVDEKIILSEHYYTGCMQVRDRYMVKHATMMIAYCHKTTGGAAYTMKIFENLHPDGEILMV